MNTKKGYIIYLDLLGYKNIIKGNNEAEIVKLRDFIDKTFSYNSIKNDVLLNKGSEFDEKKFYYNCYSDNFLVFYESNENEELGLNLAIHIGSFIMGKALMNGYMLRGSIVFGELSFNRDIVFGKSIVDAYELENSHIEPCLVLSQNLKRQFEEKEMFKSDIISPFSLSQKGDFNFINRFIDGINTLVSRLNLQSFVDERTLIKYRWIISEFNRYFYCFSSIKLIESGYHYGSEICRPEDFV